MCGIAGLCDWNGISAQAAAKVPPMMGLMQYRGPDETVSYSGERALLSCCRLAIIDLEPDAQPVRSEDGMLQCVVNGEIYNYRELRQELEASGHRLRTRSDSEVLVHLFEEHGPAFVHHLNGMFALALWNERSQELWLARDRHGAKPLFYRRQGTQFRFASELKTLRPDAAEDLNQEALADYFYFGYVPAPATIYRDVASLPAGSLMRVSDRGHTIERYWKPPDAREGRWDEREALAELSELVDNAVRLQLRSDVPVGFFLSGGVDSGVLVSRAARSNATLRTFSVGFDVPEYDELHWARQVAERAGSHHTETRITQRELSRLRSVLWHCDQPHSDASFLALYHLSELAARDVTVVLSGEGADELFYGYRKYADLPDDTPESERWSVLRRYWERERIFSPSETARLLPALGEPADPWPRLQAALRDRPYSHPADDAAFLDQTWLLPGNNLVKPDRQGSAHALEARFPFLDTRLAEWLGRLPREAKLRHGETKYLMKRLALHTLPAAAVQRPKRMFTVPVGEWMRAGELDVAGEPAVRGNAWLNQTEVARLQEEHRSGKGNHTRRLRSILHFALWAEVAASGVESPWRTRPRASRLLYA